MNFKKEQCVVWATPDGRYRGGKIYEKSKKLAGGYDIKTISGDYIIVIEGIEGKAIFKATERLEKNINDQFSEWRDNHRL